MEKVFWSGNGKDPGQREDWPEDFWKSFEGMPEDFERPAQVRQQRDIVDSFSTSE